MHSTSRPRAKRDVRSPKGELRDPLFLLTALLLAGCLAFGGASRTNELQVLALELASLPVLFMALRRFTVWRLWHQFRVELALLGAILLVPITQILPIPVELWQQLPSRQEVADLLRTAGSTEELRPISLAPHETRSAILFLLPPISVFLATCALSSKARKVLATVLLVGALSSLFLGALQIAGGGRNPLYLYEPTNYGSAVGFFANRNHHASLLLSALPFAAIWAGESRLFDKARGPILVVLGLIAFVLIIVGIAIVRSRAGVILLGPVLLMSGLLLIKTVPTKVAPGRLLALGATLLLALIIVAQFALNEILVRFESGLEFELRLLTAPEIIAAAQDHFPVGSGIGSFVPIYQDYERLQLVGPSYLNQAHNDFLQLWLEGGLLALASMLAIASWWVAKSWNAWAPSRGLQSSGLRRAASITIGMLAAHSVVDYPLRTLAMAAVFALCCAMLAPLPRSEAGADNSNPTAQ